ncbi:MAG: DnaA/Hda family protein [Gemmatimonadetes bacterium]|nr:DnaA/Hda family protein [Gemmatimonadota bacterium]
MSGNLNPRYTFDHYVVGPNSRLAVTAAHTVSENPGSAYNPLFVYGQTGLGKTHLLMAIGHRCRELSPGLVVEYFTLDEFVELYHQAVSAGAPEEFRKRFGGVHVVLLDDVQFLGHSQEMQAELLRLAVEFQSAEKQIVLTSDRPPDQIGDLDDRLLQRIDGGLIVDIGAPAYETRLAILQRRSAERGVNLSPEVLATVAGLEVQHVRALLGILNRLHAIQSVNEQPLSPEEVRSLVLGEMQTDDSPSRSTVPRALAPAPEPQVDEFDQFLTGLTVTVAEQVESWTAEIRRAIEEWAGRGYETATLEALLGQDVPGGTVAAVREYEKRVDRLRRLEAEVAEFDPDAARNPVFKSPDRVADAVQLVEEAHKNFVPPPEPSDMFSLHDFLMGDATKMALEAARAVIAQPGVAYNPLTFVGPAGVGKTHLLHSIGRTLQDASGRIVACLSAETFASELVKAIEENAVPAWRARYRHASAFLLDDVQDIGNGETVQEELFNLFNLYADSGRQLVFTSTAAPQDIQGLDDRLQSRLGGGLVATISSPDPELRRAIIVSHLESRVGAADSQLVDYLSRQDVDSVRSLLAAFNRVVSGAQAMGAALTVEIARKLLEGPPAAEVQSAARVRTSGVVVSPAGGITSREKVVWEWPDPSDRVIEELV